MARQRLRISATIQLFGLGLLPEPFTLGQLKRLYETIRGTESPFEEEPFRDRLLRIGILREAGEQKNDPHPPVRFYSFDKERYEKIRWQIPDELRKHGLNFEF